MFEKSNKPLCPLLKKPCIGDECAWYTHVRGQDPQKQQEVDLKDCAIKWLPTLLIENSKESRSVGAEINIMRNEGATATVQLVNALGLVASGAQNRATDQPLIAADGEDTLKGEGKT